jgi:copper chaperone NosL
MALGLIAAGAGKRALARVWVAAFILLAVAGLVDFWKWEYDYGHDLDTENAIIKVPGMNYQPPLIGTRQLLNFRATSLPGGGGIALAVSLGLGVLALVLDRRDRTAAVPRRAERPASHDAERETDSEQVAEPVLLS